MINAPISNISRASMEDGDGLRTVVFFSGCAMRCKWCHNPETQNAKARLMLYRDKCIGCGECTRIGCAAIGNSLCEYDPKLCTGCGKCVEACLGDALKLTHRSMSADEVVREVLKDEVFMRLSSGGVTLSGGECLLYPEFSVNVLSRVKERGIGTCVESALFVPHENVTRVMPFVDRFLIDIKIFDPEMHKEYTCVDNGLILENALYLMKNHPSVTVRIPLIPNVTDTVKNLSDIASFVKDAEYMGKRTIELLSYNPCADAKYAALGMEYTSFGKKQSDEILSGIDNLLKDRFPEIDFSVK